MRVIFTSVSKCDFKNNSKYQVQVDVSPQVQFATARNVVAALNLMWLVCARYKCPNLSTIHHWSYYKISNVGHKYMYTRVLYIYITLQKYTCIHCKLPQKRPLSFYVLLRNVRMLAVEFLMYL